MHLPGAVAVFVWGGLVVPTVFVMANAVSSTMFKNALILKVSVCRRVCVCVCVSLLGRGNEGTGLGETLKQALRRCTCLLGSACLLRSAWRRSSLVACLLPLCPSLFAGYQYVWRALHLVTIAFLELRSHVACASMHSPPFRTVSCLYLLPSPSVFFFF